VMCHRSVHTLQNTNFTPFLASINNAQIHASYISFKCVVSENVHTPTKEGIRNPRGVRRFKDSGNSRGGGGLHSRFWFEMSFDSIWIQVLI